MIISPCAMLMTPITPKVMARPIAASSSTLPRLIPSNRLATRPTNHRRFAIEASAASAAFRTSGSVPGALRISSSRLLICGSVVVPSSRTASSCSFLVPENRRAASRLRCIADRTSGSFSAAMALTSSAAAAAEGCFSASWAAASRAARSVLNMVRSPSTASISPRIRLLIWMRSRPSGSTPETASPVAASVSFVVPPIAVETTTRPSVVLNSRSSSSAFSTGTARGSPSLPSATTACSLAANPSASSFATSAAKSSAQCGHRRRRQDQRRQDQQGTGEAEKAVDHGANLKPDPAMVRRRPEGPAAARGSRDPTLNSVVIFG